jgi:DNA-binding NarL/FixJ family response regulator
VAEGLRKLRNARRRTRALGLTEREIEIARAVVAGYTNKEIARRSSISENTVKSHLMHIFNKLGASNRVELAIFAAHHRVLDGV